ncbi:MAG: mycothiol synthase, partial [Micrococcales bacterium]|nr:mycothiol synthase [Micrococcales bacterium]
MTFSLDRTVGALDPGDMAAALDLAFEVAAHDAVPAVSEAFLQALITGDPAVTHLLAWNGHQLVGYGQIDGPAVSAELAV